MVQVTDCGLIFFYFRAPKNETVIINQVNFISLNIVSSASTSLACSATHYTDETDTHHAQIKEHESGGNNGSNNRKQLTTVANDSHDTKCQSSRECEHYQQPSKGSNRIASPRLN